MKVCISIGGISYRIDSPLSAIPPETGPYLCADTASCVDIRVTAADLAREQVLSPEAASLQSAILRKLAYDALQRGRLLIHGACIAYEGKSYLFLAPSGTGKTTHIRLWKKMLGDRVTILCGDKPFLSLTEPICAFGTPWNGKEGLGCPGTVPLAAVVELRRAENNSIAPMKKAEAFACLFRQCYLLDADGENRAKLVAAAKTVTDRVPAYLLRCNTEPDAFSCAFSALTGEARP